MSLEDLQGRCKIDKSNISKYELGRVTPDFKTIERLAEGLGVPVRDVLAP